MAGRARNTNSCSGILILIVICIIFLYRVFIFLVNNPLLFLGGACLLVAIFLPINRKLDMSMMQTDLSNIDYLEKLLSKHWSTDLSNIDNMDGQSFEYWCQDLFERMGYTNLTTTQGSGDFGVDIIGYYNNEKVAIQCKRYENKVGNKAVQEVFSGANYYSCNRAIVVTNNYFTPQAIETARVNGVQLIDRNELTSILREIAIVDEQRKPEIQAQIEKLKADELQRKLEIQIQIKKHKSERIIIKIVLAVVAIPLLIFAIINFNSSDTVSSNNKQPANTSTPASPSTENTHSINDKSENNEIVISKRNLR